VFLDEVNTSSCIGLFKEIIIDKSIDGKVLHSYIDIFSIIFLLHFQPLPDNVFLVAACNPHRGNSLVIHENKEEYKTEAWVRGSYYVQKLHPTLRFLMWDYGSLDKEQELAYVKEKMIMVNKDFDM